MAGAHSFPEETGNWLLAALPQSEQRRLFADLELVRLDREKVLHEAGRPISYVYFPCGGLISLLCPLGNGKVAEVAAVGNEGVVGLPAFLSSGVALYDALVQVPGPALRIETSRFKTRIAPTSSLVAILLRYAEAFLGQVSLCAACNCHHPVSQRLCRWLLMAHDRVATDRLPFTQKLLALMLAVRSASVSDAASPLKRAGLIHYSQGNLTILDRIGMEAACCGCYRSIQDRFERLLGGRPASSADPQSGRAGRGESL